MNIKININLKDIIEIIKWCIFLIFALKILK